MKYPYIMNRSTICVCAFHTLIASVFAQTSPDAKTSQSLPVISNADIIETDVRSIGNIKFILQEVTEQALPSDRLPVMKAPDAVPATVAQDSEIPSNATLLQITGTSYYGSALGSQVRTRYTLWKPSGQKTISFWSSMQPECLAGVTSFTIGDNETSIALILSSTTIDLDKEAALHAERGQSYAPPSIPKLSVNPATFLPADNILLPEEVSIIQTLHDFYNKNLESLKAQAVSRQAAREHAEAVQAAKRTEPKEITVRFRLLSEEETK